MNEQDFSNVPMGEAHMEFSEAELAELRQRADGGDLQAIDRLINYYLINYGDESEDAMDWRLRAARRGDCERWNDLMFMEEDGVAVPARFFSEGETLKSIGEANGCPPYAPRKAKFR